jgi:hypothetical protein
MDIKLQVNDFFIELIQGCELEKVFHAECVSKH